MRVDIGVGDAGLDYDKPLFTGDTVEWRHVLEVNVFGLCVIAILIIT